VRLVLDTNVVASGLLWSGAPSRLIHKALDGEVELATSPPLLAELAGILPRRRFADQVERQSLSVEALVLRYAELARTVAPAPIEPVVIADPDDDEVLACALAARADLIVSGDRLLLELRSFMGIPIVAPTEALRRIEQSASLL
jgi:putative PIN family toxin of toxin-antitoxin system